MHAQMPCMLQSSNRSGTCIVLIAEPLTDSQPGTQAATHGAVPELRDLSIPVIIDR